MMLMTIKAKNHLCKFPRSKSVTSPKHVGNFPRLRGSYTGKRM